MADKKHEVSDHDEKKDVSHGPSMPKEGEADNRDLTVSGTIRSPTQAEQLAGGAPGLTISGEHQTAPDDYVTPGGDPSQVPDAPDPPEARKPPPTEEEITAMRKQAREKEGQELPTIAGTKYTEETIKEAAEKDNAERWKKAEEREKSERERSLAAHESGHTAQSGQSGFGKESAAEGSGSHVAGSDPHSGTGGAQAAGSKPAGGVGGGAGASHTTTRGPLKR